MSKLNPLTSALVVILPFALTACGSSDGATAGNDHKSNNLSDNHKSNVSQDQHQHDQVTNTTELNTNSNGKQTTNNFPATSSLYDTGSNFNPLPASHGNANKNSQHPTTSNDQATPNNNVAKGSNVAPAKSEIITHIDQDVASSSVANADDNEIFPEKVNLPAGSQISQQPVQEPASKPASYPESGATTNITTTQPGSAVKPTASNSNDSNQASNTISNQHDSSISKPATNNGSSTSTTAPITPSHSTYGDNNIGNNQATLIVPPTVAPTNPLDNTSNTGNIPGAIYNTVDEHPEYVRFANHLTSGITIGMQSEDAQVFLNNYRIDRESIQDQILADQIKHQYDNKLSFIEARIDASSVLKSTKNKNFLLFLNYYPVAQGDFIRPLSNAPLSVKKHDGSGVKVAIIDGALNPSDLNFDFFNPPTYLHYDNDTTQIFSNTIIESDKKGNHGTEVGLIIAGKQNFNNLGLAPQVNLTYSQISTTPDFISIYKAVNASNPTVVNNSYSFSGLKNQIVDFNEIHNFFLQQAKKHSYPLYVFAAGNQPTQFNNTTQTYELDREHLQYSPSYNLIQMVNDYALRDMFITVTGVKIEIPANTLSSYQNDLKQWEDTGFDNNQPKPRLVASKDFLTHDDIAVPCGDTMWSCMAGFNQYYVSTSLSNNDSGLIVGTSYAAPQVSAAAALVKQNFPWMTASNLKTTLLTTATDLGDVGVDRIYGWGLLNFARALRGPMQFAFGDFYANLNNDTNTYYFANNIFGKGGLIVSATNRKGMLILTGKNTYEGDTTVMGGRLVVTDKITSKLQVQSNGSAFISQAQVGTTVNNGFIVAKDTTINGNYTQGSMATLMLEPNRPMHVTGTAHLNGTVALDKLTEYVGTGATSRFYPILTAYKIADGSHFTQQRIDNQVNYHIYYDYAHNTVLTQMSRKNASHVANRLFDDDPYATNDEIAYRAGGTIIEQFLSDADHKVADPSSSITKGGAIFDNSQIGYADSFLASSDADNNVSTSSRSTTIASTADSAKPTNSNPVVAKALEIINSSDSDMRKLIYDAADTAVANSILANSDTQDLANQRFTTKVVSDFSLPVGQFQAYVNYDYGNTTWHDNQSNVQGKYIKNGVTAGVFTSYYQYNLGLAVSTDSNIWNQGYHNTNDAHVTGNTLGFQAVTARNFDDVYVATELGFNNFSFTSDRTVLASNIHAKYQAQQYRTGLVAGGDFKLSDSLDLNLQAGLRYAYTHLNSFSETGNDAVGQAFAFSFKPQHQQQINADLGAGVTYNFNSFGYQHELKTIIGLHQVLHGNKFKFNTNYQNVQVQSTFNNRTTVSLDLGYAIHISHSLSLDLNAKFSKSASWSNKNANLALNVQF